MRRVPRQSRPFRPLKRPQVKWKRLDVGESVLIAGSRLQVLRLCARWSRKLNRAFVITRNVNPRLHQVTRYVGNFQPFERRHKAGVVDTLHRLYHNLETTP